MLEVAVSYGRGGRLPGLGGHRDRGVELGEVGLNP
jgi:hypothetical protein